MTGNSIATAASRPTIGASYGARSASRHETRGKHPRGARKGRNDNHARRRPRRTPAGMIPLIRRCRLRPRRARRG
jgi:hypothetical protein